jgi:hypothetical protein
MISWFRKGKKYLHENFFHEAFDVESDCHVQENAVPGFPLQTYQDPVLIRAIAPSGDRKSSPRNTGRSRGWRFDPVAGYPMPKNFQTVSHNSKPGDILLNPVEKGEAEWKAGSRTDPVFCRM